CVRRPGRRGGPSPYRASRRRPETALLTPPLVDLRVVSRKQDVRHAPAPKIHGACVVRVLEPAPDLGREALDETGLLRPERTGKPPRDRVHHDHRGQLAAGEDVRAYRDGIGGEMREDALVEPLEAGGQKRQPLLAGELLDDRLGQLPALWRQRND